MKTVTFQVLDGIDKGRVFRDMAIPVTIGREEGNLLRLNDERVSRYHAKVQLEDGDVILTDLDSTNGTRVNGQPVQIRRLRPGDQIIIGRSTLMFGTTEEIANYQAAQRASQGGAPLNIPDGKTHLGELPDDAGFAVNLDGAPLPPNWNASDTDRPPLPQKLNAAQSARLAEVFDFLHRGISQAMETIEATDDRQQIKMSFGEWQTLQAVQKFLAQYSREIAEPTES
ncbi:FHA domain-containing protein [Tuwongella immobilis]|uniref:FHA domain-containing protein n=1 Tax=Tuwongella immobilis TaxID=692036 RepID=A0A6C2YHW9_9BACT|nr:FHA domain-containing protein [Tuwongella immobilis]VIP00733.1 fha domain containing protein : Uncharacterized protein OS=Blastopirellula marina DSM 3645 GN=DSM3645_00275 PE=4 SV=1: FHA [Tuwongella immobilis]VTR96884.1 fha domain containing protein : Uncharacterized protein OS=Blastopirellula marina DSM 3645 GN=DSM3645_00275 PE=4 SV=1: FHA [Tuwongella immobilis]